MNILLLNPPLLMEERSSLRVVRHTQEPLGLAYLAAAIRTKRKQDKITILDCQVLNYSIDDVETYFLKNTFEVVAISVPTLTFYNTQKTSEIIKKISDAKIIIGGPHPTALPADSLEEVPEIDFAVIGEGEEIIIELLSAIENKSSVKDIKGIAYRDGGEVKVNRPGHYNENLDSIPLPARDLLPMKLYSPSPTFYQRAPAYSVIDARGCPYACTFCATLYGRSIRSHSIARICEEVELLIKDYGAKCIIFRSDTFTTNIRRAIELCEEMIKRGLNKKILWHCQSRINTVTEDALKLMRRAGCEGIHYGVESGNERLVRIIDKRIKLEDVTKVFKWTKRAGITVSAYFMLGIPTETKEESLKTIAYSKKCGCEFGSFSIFTPYPGSALFDQIKAEGKLRTRDWRNFSSELSFSQRIAPYVPEGRDEMELKQLHRRAILEFYLRPNIILRHLIKIKSFNRLKILIKGFYCLLAASLKRTFSSKNTKPQYSSPRQSVEAC